ncbi:MAG: hypothetical protein WA231_14340 [Methylocella sp.]
MAIDYDWAIYRSNKRVAVHIAAAKCGMRVTQKFYLRAATFVRAWIAFYGHAGCRMTEAGRHKKVELHGVKDWELRTFAQ